MVALETGGRGAILTYLNVLTKSSYGAEEHNNILDHIDFVLVPITTIFSIT
jgi:hypothetical protein